MGCRSFLVAFVWVWVVVLVSGAAALEATELVETVCRGTSNYNFCVEALYSDSRTADADRYTLAYIAFGLLYEDAKSTLDHVTALERGGQGQQHPRPKSLTTCHLDYDKAISFIQSAFNDLDSETYFTLDRHPARAARAALHCSSAYPPLAPAATHFNALSQICLAVAKLFTTS